MVDRFQVTVEEPGIRKNIGKVPVAKFFASDDFNGPNQNSNGQFVMIEAELKITVFRIPSLSGVDVYAPRMFVDMLRNSRLLYRN
jgi:hypothetical protein